MVRPDFYEYPFVLPRKYLIEGSLKRFTINE